MMEHGLTLLERAIDFRESTSRSLVLRSGGLWHFIGPTDRCVDMVYLSRINVREELVQLANPFFIDDQIRIYRGQTITFAQGKVVAQTMPWSTLTSKSV